MKNDCSQMQEEILSSDGVFSLEVEQHCAGCESCRKVRKNWHLLCRVKSAPEISLSNDFAIITAARKYARSQKRQINIRRVLGYAAATASGIAAVYSVMFHGPLPSASNEMFRKSWNWDTFEERVFVLDTATEISQQDITIGSTDNDALDEFIETEINIKNI